MLPRLRNGPVPALSFNKNESLNKTAEFVSHFSWDLRQKLDLTDDPSRGQNSVEERFSFTHWFYMKNFISLSSLFCGKATHSRPRT